jgi:hypothetical protein
MPMSTPKLNQPADAPSGLWDPISTAGPFELDVIRTQELEKVMEDWRLNETRGSFGKGGGAWELGPDCGHLGQKCY